MSTQQVERLKKALIGLGIKSSEVKDYEFLINSHVKITTYDGRKLVWGPECKGPIEDGLTPTP